MIPSLRKGKNAVYDRKDLWNRWAFHQQWGSHRW